MTGHLLLAKFLEDKKMTARDFCRASDGLLNEPELSRYLAGGVQPRVDKALAIEKVSKKRVPVKSWAKHPSLAASFVLRMRPVGHALFLALAGTAKASERTH